MEDNQGSNNDIQLRAGNQSQFNGAFEVENLGFSSNTKNFTGGPYSGNNLNTSVLNGSSNTYFARMDGVQRLSGTDYTTNLDGRKLKLWLFSNRTGNRELEGKFGEMVMYNSNSSDLAIKTEGYLAHKWGMTSNLPNSHIYKNNKPVTGFTATYSATLYLDPTKVPDGTYKINLSQGGFVDTSSNSNVAGLPTGYGDFTIRVINDSSTPTVTLSLSLIHI